MIRPTGGRSATLGIGAILALACGLPASAQPQVLNGLPAPRLASVFPAGGRAGTQFDLTVAGQELDDAEALWFSLPGATAERLPEIAGPPIEFRNPQPNPAQRGRRGVATPSSVRFRVRIPADAPLGIHDVRVVGPLGISNPRAFVVGDLPEDAEDEPNDDVDKAQRIELNSVVHGAVPTPLDVDFFVFAGQKGQRVVVSCLTTSIDSRLEAAVELFDATGRPIAANHGYRENDAVADAALPADGDYLVRVHHFTYTRGGADQFYRLAVGTAPWIDAVYPPMVGPGQAASVTVWGRNLPGGQPDPSALADGAVPERATTTIQPPGDPASLLALAFGGSIPPAMSGVDGFDFRIRNDQGVSNPAFLAYARDPVVLDAGNNDRSDQAQAVSLPCEIAGRVESRGDRDWYAFDAKKGETLSIEAWGDRLGAPVDLFFLLRSPDGKQVLFEADENLEILNPVQFYTRTDDPARQRFVAPADGRYTLLISAREATARSDARYVYRLRIGPERPDFRLVAMPSAMFATEANVLRAGGRVEYRVFAWRQDGFDGEIRLDVEGLPPGVVAAVQGIGPALRQGSVILTAAPDAPPWTGEIRIIGRATLAGSELRREARASSICWPTLQGTNAPALARLDRGHVLAVRPDKPPYTLAVDSDKLTVFQGEKVEIAFKAQRLWEDFKTPIQVQATGLPTNVNMPQATLNPNNDAAKSTVTIPQNSPPGEYFVVLNGTANFPHSRDPKAQNKPNIQVAFPATPVSLLLVPKELAKLAVEPGAPSVKAGEQTEVVVRATRQFGHSGELKVEFVPPADAQGLSADPVVIPAGADSARLILKATADAPPGNRGNLVLRATGLFREGVAPVVQEIKFGVNINKN